MIHPATRIGAVHLTVRRLDDTAAFWRDHLGLAEVARDARTVALGAGGVPLIVLHGDAAAPTVPRATGLYHVAILLPSRRELAALVRHFAARRTPLSGASDHHVSEAIYLADPEGNGIEVYRDRPREGWRDAATGAVAMTTRALDMDDLLAESAVPGPWRMPAGTTVGHVHLKVNDIADAERFYVDALGFDLVTRYGRAATFVSAGGYHHHVGFNTWESAGAAPPPEGAAGLAWYEVVLPDAAARDAVVARLAQRGFPAQQGHGGVTVRDPAGNRVALVTA